LQIILARRLHLDRTVLRQRSASTRLFFCAGKRYRNKGLKEYSRNTGRPEYSAAGHTHWRHPAAIRIRTKNGGYAALRRRDVLLRRLAPALRRMLAARRTRLNGFLFAFVAPLRGARRVLLAVLAMAIASLSIVFCPYESLLT
jgi:hypothetical protein